MRFWGLPLSPRLVYRSARPENFWSVNFFLGNTSHWVAKVCLMTRLTGRRHQKFMSCKSLGFHDAGQALNNPGGIGRDVKHACKRCKTQGKWRESGWGLGLQSALYYPRAETPDGTWQSIIADVCTPSARTARKSAG